MNVNSDQSRLRPGKLVLQLRGVGLAELMMAWGPLGPVRAIRGGKRTCPGWAPRILPPLGAPSSKGDWDTGCVSGADSEAEVIWGINTSPLLRVLSRHREFRMHSWRLSTLFLSLIQERCVTGWICVSDPGVQK